MAEGTEHQQGSVPQPVPEIPGNCFYQALGNYESEFSRKKYQIAVAEDTIAHLKSQLESVRIRNGELKQNNDKLQLELEKTNVQFECDSKRKEKLVAEKNILEAELAEINETVERKFELIKSIEARRLEKMESFAQKRAEYEAEYRTIPAVKEFLELSEKCDALEAELEEKAGKIAEKKMLLEERKRKSKENWESFVKMCIKLAESRRKIEALNKEKKMMERRQTMSHESAFSISRNALTSRNALSTISNNSRPSFKASTTAKSHVNQSVNTRSAINGYLQRLNLLKTKPYVPKTSILDTRIRDTTTPIATISIRDTTTPIATNSILVATTPVATTSILNTTTPIASSIEKSHENQSVNTRSSIKDYLQRLNLKTKPSAPTTSILDTTAPIATTAILDATPIATTSILDTTTPIATTAILDATPIATTSILEATTPIASILDTTAPIATTSILDATPIATTSILDATPIAAVKTTSAPNKSTTLTTSTEASKGALNSFGFQNDSFFNTPSAAGTTPDAFAFFNSPATSNGSLGFNISEGTPIDWNFMSSSASNGQQPGASNSNIPLMDIFGAGGFTNSSEETGGVQMSFF